MKSRDDGDVFDDQTSIQLEAPVDGDPFYDQTSIQLKARADDDAFDAQVRIQLKAPAEVFLVACIVSTVKDYCGLCAYCRDCLHRFIASIQIGIPTFLPSAREVVSLLRANKACMRICVKMNNQGSNEKSYRHPHVMRVHALRTLACSTLRYVGMHAPNPSARVWFRSPFAVSIPVPSHLEIRGLRAPGLSRRVWYQVLALAW